MKVFLIITATILACILDTKGMEIIFSLLLAINFFLLNKIFKKN